MSSNSLENKAHIFSIAASIVAILTFLFGIHQFNKTMSAQRETIELERETQAIELLLKYNETMTEGQSKGDSTQYSPEFWRYSTAIAIAESIFRMRKGDEGWKETVLWLISLHKKTLNDSGLLCNTYDKEFIELINNEMEESGYSRDVCR